MEFINRKIGCNGQRFSSLRLSPITAANAANDQDKPLILLYGGPGRFSTFGRNQRLSAKVRQLSAFEGERRIFTRVAPQPLVIPALSILRNSVVSPEEDHQGTL